VVDYPRVKRHQWCS